MCEAVAAGFVFSGLVPIALQVLFADFKRSLERWRRLLLKPPKTMMKVCSSLLQLTFTAQ